MRFSPKSEEEIQLMGLVPNGIYPFEVIGAKDTLSKANNEMIELVLKIWDASNREIIIYDYLLEAMAFKLIHFCRAVGLLQKYESGEIAAMDCIGKSGRLELIIQKGRANPGGGNYPDKNSVKDYLEADKSQADAPLSDDIPF